MSAVFCRKLGIFLTLVFVTWGLIVGLHTPLAVSQVPAQERVNQIVVDLSAQIGRSLTRPVVVDEGVPSASAIADALGDERARGWWGVAMPARQESDPTRPGRMRWTPQLSGSMDTCLITLTLEGELLPGAARDSLLAHEVYHCFQIELLGIEAQSRLPQWLKEGSATWVGETFAGSSIASATHWERYLRTAGSLLERDYDAVGFFAHLQNSGVNVWRELDDLLQLPPALAFSQAARDGGDDFLQTWPMGLSRRPDLGAGWDTDGPGILPREFRRAEQSVIVSAESPFSQTLDPADQRLIQFFLFPGEVVRVQASGYGALRWLERGGETTRFSNHFSQSFCVGESCRCADGSQPPGVQAVPGNGALLAVTSTEAPGQIDIHVVESPCDERPDDPAEGDSGDAAVPSGSGWTGGDRARGTSYGDPHIITYDGLRYSFQTVGEYLLSQTQDGHFVVQARQKQVPGRQLSLNTAAAMQVGNHRVAFYTQDFPDGSSPLWVDGQPRSVNEVLPLGDGSALVPLNNRNYVVHWATGESVAIRRIESGGLPFINITPYVPRAQAGQLMGLLGDLNTNADDDLRIRNGAVVPSRSSYSQVRQLVRGLVPSAIPLNQLETAYFEQLYRQFGDSWRIQPQESLFDYGPGQSTESFTNRAFPTAFPTLAGVSSAQINSARQTCQQAGVEDIFLDGCIFDVAATGQPDFANAAANAIADVLVQEATDRLVNELRQQIEEVLPPIRIPRPRLPF
jgi:hypothetical protein